MVGTGVHELGREIQLIAPGDDAASKMCTAPNVTILESDERAGEIAREIGDSAGAVAEREVELESVERVDAGDLEDRHHPPPNAAQRASSAR